MSDIRIRAWLSHPDKNGVAIPDEQVMIVHFLMGQGIWAIVYSEKTGEFDAVRIDRLTIR